MKRHSRSIITIALTVSILALILTSLWNPEAARAKNPVQPRYQEIDHNLPARIVVRTQPHGFLGLSAAPDAKTLSPQVEQATQSKPMLIQEDGDYQVYSFDRPMGQEELTDLMQQIARLEGVAEVFQDAVAQPALMPNDSFIHTQLNYYAATQGGMNILPAWDITTGGADVVIAVLDTGQINHPDLNNRWTAGYDFVDASLSKDGDGYDADPTDPGDSTGSSTNSWHGAHVAGIIGAQGNNAVGIAGVNWGSPIMAVRVLGAGGGYLSDIANAIRWAAGVEISGIPANPTPARIINMSLGAAISCDSYTQAAIDAATAKGAIVVVAAGNSAMDISGYTPAGCRNVVAVGSNSNNVTPDLSYFSNYGALTIAASGESILSTINDGTNTVGNPTYGYKWGTSMAAPHAAGIISLMLAVNPALQFSDVVDILRQTAQPFPSEASLCSQHPCGPGIIDAMAAIQLAQNYVPSQATATLIATQTATSTRTPAPSNTPTVTRTPTATRTITQTRAPTATRTPAPTRTITQTRTPTATRTITQTRAPTATRTITQTRAPTATRTPAPTRTITQTRAPTATRTPIPTQPTRTPTSTRTPTATRTP